MRSAMAIQVLPLSGGSRERVWTLVDKAITVIDKSGLSYTVGPMETVVEGPLERLVEVAKEAHLAVVEASGGTVSTYIKLVSGNDIGTAEEKVRKYRDQGH